MPEYPHKPPSDDSTVDTDADESTIPETKSTMKEKKNNVRKRHLTTVSAKYDLDGDGILDEAEQAMRDRDLSGRGYLSNEEIYEVVQEQLKAQKSAGYMRKLVLGLTGFVVILALSNLGTSLAAAFLAKDLAAGDDAVMRVSATGDIAAAQSVADVYETTEMTEEEVLERRLLVLREMDEDPHSHPHRRQLKKNKGGKGGANSRITFDSQAFDVDEFLEITEKCQRQKNVYLKRKWGDDTRNECICARGASVVVKEKKKKGKDKNNKNKNKNKGKDDKKSKSNSLRDKEVIIDYQGRTLHADCTGGKCYCGGTLLRGSLNDACRLSGFFDECEGNLVCTPVAASRVNKNVRSRSSSSSSEFGTCQEATRETQLPRQARMGMGSLCFAGRDECDPGHYCLPDSFDPVWYRQAAAVGALGTGGGAYNGAQAIVMGPSGMNAGGAMMSGAMNSNAIARSREDLGLIVYEGMGTCVRTVGAGQTCFSDVDCGGRFGSCLGLGDPMGKMEVIQGSSGTIMYSTGIPGAIEVEGVCSG